MSSSSESYAGFYLVGFIGAVVGTVFALVVFGTGILTERTLSQGHTNLEHGSPQVHGNAPAEQH